MAGAVSGYVAGALTIAVIAGVATYIVLTILGVPFSGPLAVMAGLLSLIPMVGATIAAVLIGIVTAVRGLPHRDDHLDDLGDRLPAAREQPDPAPDPEAHRATCTRSSRSSRCCSAARCSGCMGAIVAIPVAASIQILLREYVDLRTLSLKTPSPA